MTFKDEVAGRHPLKQGLKPVDSICLTAPVQVAGRHPLKQGLKRHYLAYVTYARCRRAASTKTRIETDAWIGCNHHDQTVSQGGIH